MPSFAEFSTRILGAAGVITPQAEAARLQSLKEKAESVPVAAAPAATKESVLCDDIKAAAKAAVGTNAGLVRVEIALGEANHGVSCSKPTTQVAQR